MTHHNNLSGAQEFGQAPEGEFPVHHAHSLMLKGLPGGLVIVSIFGHGEQPLLFVTPGLHYGLWGQYYAVKAILETHLTDGP